MSNATTTREALRSAEDALRRQADDLAELAQSLR